MLAGSVDAEIEDAEVSSSVQVGDGKITVQVITQNLAAPGQSRKKAKGSKKKPNWRPFIDTWKKRRERYEATMKQFTFVTPTLLKQQEENGEIALPRRRAGLKREPALLVGDLAHRFLQRWDFAADPSSLADQVSAFAQPHLARETKQNRRNIENELREVARNFSRSAVYAELAEARILGREVPLLMPWNGQIMEGVIDLIYETNGLLYLADYKTDRIAPDNLRQGAERYRQQAEIYSQAVRQSLGREPAAFKIIFLRLGEAVELGIEKNKELSLF
jgi:ATP-dependent helicase/nuclease subunit A